MKNTRFQKGHIPANKGKHLSLEHREKMRLAKIINPSKTSFKKGHKGYTFWKGKHLSEETKKKISNTKMSKPRRDQFGEKNPFWKGGVTKENKRMRNLKEFRLWREAVFARDNWTCQKYGKRGGKLHPHHIQNFSQFPELRFAIDNGITLSEIAHREFHKKYGRKNNTVEQIKDFFKPNG